MKLGARSALPLLLLCACFGGGSPPVAATDTTQLDDAQIAAFSQRIEGFYKALEDVPLDALVTYENKQLRDCFASQAAFSDYFSSLATEARDLSFRDTAARSVRIREFWFESPDRAGVDVTFTSVHQRKLRFWSIGFTQHDVWENVDGVWQIVPAKL